MWVMGDWEFLIPQKKSATYPLHMGSLGGLQEDVCTDEERISSKFFTFSNWVR